MSYRQENRRRWQTVAAGWEKHADDIRRDTMPVTSWMLDALEPQPGHALLELADQALGLVAGIDDDRGAAPVGGGEEAVLRDRPDREAVDVHVSASIG